MPVTAKYQITEKANAGTASYIIRTDAEDGVSGGTFVKSSDGNKYADKDLSTAVETVDEGENATVTFTNDMPNTVDINLSKKVTGSIANKNHFFKFAVSVTGAGKNHTCTIDYDKGSKTHDGKNNPESFTTDESGYGKAYVYLKHGDTVTIKDVPLNAKYSIAEDSEDYTQSITVNGKSAESVSERSAAGDDVVFTNNLEGHNRSLLATGRRDALLVTVISLALLAFAFYRKLKLKK